MRALCLCRRLDPRSRRPRRVGVRLIDPGPRWPRKGTLCASPAVTGGVRVAVCECVTVSVVNRTSRGRGRLVVSCVSCDSLLVIGRLGWRMRLRDASRLSTPDVCERSEVPDAIASRFCASFSRFRYRYRFSFTVFQSHVQFVFFDIFIIQRRSNTCTHGSHVSRSPTPCSRGQCFTPN